MILTAVKEMKAAGTPSVSRPTHRPYRPIGFAQRHNPSPRPACGNVT
jgi:hypothetical protein